MAIPKAVIGQSAIEYLMTYGWMLLVVAVVGGTVFSVAQSDTPDTVSGFIGSNVVIDDFGVTGNEELQLVLRNGGSESVTVREVTITDSDTGEVLPWAGDLGISVADTAVVDAGSVEVTGSPNTLDVEIVYDSGNLENLQVSGTISSDFVIDFYDQWELVNEWETEDSIYHSAFSNEYLAFGGFNFQDRNIYSKEDWENVGDWFATGSLNQADFSDDGEYLAVISAELSVHSRPDWNQELLLSIQPQGSAVSFLYDSNDLIYEDTANYDEDSLVLIEDLDEDEDTVLEDEIDIPRSGGLTTSENFVVFAEGGKTGGDQVFVWNASDIEDDDGNREVQVLDDGGDGFDDAQAVSLSQGSEFLAIGESDGEGSVFLYEWDDSGEEFVLDEKLEVGDFSYPNDFSREEGGSSYFAHADDGDVVIRSVGDWDEVERLEEASSLATVVFSEKYIGYGGFDDEYFVHIYDPSIFD